MIKRVHSTIIHQMKVKMRSSGRLKRENDTIFDQSYCTIQLHSNYTVLFYEIIIFPLI